ncbi:hypothetical protein STXM2123_5783 [Streptomyces sp. F-3]|nr:hypothetical protein STXM2123_5783 [Streptomyces sp. F-3]
MRGAGGRGGGRTRQGDASGKTCEDLWDGRVRRGAVPGGCAVGRGICRRFPTGRRHSERRRARGWILGRRPGGGQPVCPGGAAGAGSGPGAGHQPPGPPRDIPGHSRDKGGVPSPQWGTWAARRPAARTAMPALRPPIPR